MTGGEARLFDRAVRLTILPPDSDTKLNYGNASPDCVPLRVGFQVERTLEGTADKAKIMICNVSASNRNLIAPGSFVTIYAGYKLRSGVLFTGFVDKVKTTKNGPDTFTECECSDGGLNISFATVKRTYATAVSLAHILQDLAQDLSLTLGGSVISTQPGVIFGIPNVWFARGVTLDGPVSLWLNRLLIPRGMSWFIQKGTLNITPINQPSAGSACAVLSAATGMIDEPSLNEKGLVVSSLLNSDILPGRMLQLASKNEKLDGFYKILTAKYEGDTHDQSWRVEVECQAITDAVRITPLALPTDFQIGVI